MVTSGVYRIPAGLGTGTEKITDTERNGEKDMHRKNVRKKIASVLLILLAFSAHALAAFADDGTAMGNFSELEEARTQTQSEDSAAAEGTREITLSGGTSYSPETQLFYYAVESCRFGISVPDGAIVTEAVRISPDSSLTTELYKNGIKLENVDLSSVSGAGKYILSVSENGALQEKRVSFTILGSPTNAVKEYILPADFYLMSATLNGSDASASQTYVDMADDGDYVISYRSPMADVDMQLAVTIDHTAPTATLSGIVDGKANGPVTVSDVEEGAEIFLLRNGKQYSYTDEIAETGSYTLTVKDAAGNETAYDFVVVTYANSSLKALILTGVVLVLALIAYIIFCRKYNRVR